MAKILIAEDDAELNSVVRTFLLFEHHQVESAANGDDAMALLQSSDFDLLILDWDLPGKSGLEIIDAFHSSGRSSPILMITGKTQVGEKKTGLDAGADDYLTKPFHLDELGARVRALLRRTSKSYAKGNVINVRDMSLDVVKHRLTKGGEPVELLPKEFQLLEFLMRHPNHVFTPDSLLSKVWPSESDATAEALRSTVKRLRKKIDPDGNLLRTVHGVGYKLESDENV